MTDPARAGAEEPSFLETLLEDPKLRMEFIEATRRAVLWGERS